MRHTMSVSIAHTARYVPRIPFEVIADDILGREYSLSLVFVGARRSRALNQKTRGKEYVPNVLSFPLDKKHGEIFITPVVAKREASVRDVTPGTYIGFLFIHGLLHLKGHVHGDTMDRAEQTYMEKYFKRKDVRSLFV